MDTQSGFNRWGPVLGAALLAVGVGVVAYSAGVSHGLAEQPLPAGVPPVYPMYYRPWGFGPLFPLFFLVFWFLAFRLVLPRRRWWRGGPGYYGYYGPGPNDVPPMFEEWHRRSHAREADAPPPNRT